MRVQKAKIRRVIRKEHDLIAENLVGQACGNPGHCAIGALLFAAGCSNRYLASISSGPADWGDQMKATRVLRKEYGLTIELACGIVAANDSEGRRAGVEERRSAVLAAVDRLPALLDEEDGGAPTVDADFDF